MRARSGALLFVGLSLSACAPAFTVSPGAASAPPVYASPFRVEDLDPHERIICGDHASAIQGQGKDFRVSRWVGGMRWSVRRSDAPADPAALRNEHSVVHGRPFHAVAAGEVIGCWRNAPENAVIGQKHSALDAGLIPRSGNHLWVRHDDGIVALYAHAIPGSIPAELCPHEGRLFDASAPLFVGNPNVHPNAWVPAGVDPRRPSGDDVRRPRVERGQFLGRVGNSGNSTGPHLHLHMEDPGHPTSKPHPMRFAPFAWTPLTVGKADPNRWRAARDVPLPPGEVLWWPSPAPPVVERVHFGVPAADFQRLFDQLAAAGFWPSWLDGYSVAGRPCLNSIWRPAPARWRCWTVMTEASYLARRSQAIAEGLQMLALDSSLVAGQPRYSVVFAAGAGEWLGRHHLDEKQHLALMREAQARKLAPVTSSVIVIDGQLRYTVLYRSGNRGMWRIDDHVPEDALQGRIAEARRAGLQPSAMSGYVENGRRYLAVVLVAKPVGRVDLLTGLSLPRAQAAAEVSKGEGLRAEAVTGYDGAPGEHQLAVLMREPPMADEPGDEEGGVLP
jgi:Bacterial tandem repeat domain 1